MSKNTVLHNGSTYSLKFFTCVVSIFLAGCTSMAPTYERPDTSIPTTYSTNIKSAISTPAADIYWRDYFTDPKLVQLIEQALENNLDLRSAILKVQEAQAAYGIQRSVQFPNTNVDLSSSRSRTPSSLSPTGQASIGNNFQAGLGISNWEIDLWGRIASLNEAALQDFLATDAAHRAVHLTLITQVADAYIGLLEVNERLRLAKASESSQRKSLQIFKRRYEVGSASHLELTQVETLVSQAESLVVQLEQMHDTQRLALGILLGDMSRSNITTTENKPLELNMMDTLNAGLPSDLLYDRPDVIAAEHRLKSANANIGAARAAFFPRISLNVFGGAASSELDNLLKGASRAWNFIPNISLPIFDAGRNQANLDLAEVRKNLAIVEYERAIQNAFRDVANALSDQHWSLKQVEVKQRATATQRERARLSKLSYDNGASSFLEVLDAERNLIFAEQELVQTKRVLLSNRVALYAALGGGSKHINDAPLLPKPIIPNNSLKP